MARELPSIAQLNARHFRRVWWVVRSAGVPDEAIEDVVHDVFVALHHRLPSYDGRLPLERWLMGVARNAAFTHRRGAARRSLRAAELAQRDVDPADLDDELAQTQAWRELQRFLFELPADQREVFTLIELHGDSAPWVAEALAVKLNTVYARLRLARGKFDRWLAAQRHRDPQWTHHAAQGGAPRETQRARAWAAIAVSLRAPATTIASVSPAKLLLLFGGLASAGAIAFALRSDASPRPRLVAPSPAAMSSRPVPEHAPRVATAAMPGPTAAPMSSTPADTPASATTRRGPPARERAPEQATPTTMPAGDDEQRWLARAHEAIAGGDIEGALSWIDRHAQSFPASALAPERVVLRVDALCRAGRRGDAEAAIAAWRAGGSSALPRIAARLDARLAAGC